MNTSIRLLEQEDQAIFADLVLQYIPRGYDDIDETFPARIVEAHFKGYDPFGYFTVRKAIWALDENSGPAGFVVAAEKRGGSVKFGPTVIDPKYQQGGMAGRLWKLLEDEYRNNGKRKVYGTWPALRVDVLKFASRMEWKIEALLQEQYRPGQDEYIAGKFLAPPAPPPVTVQIWNETSPSRKVKTRLLEASDFSAFSSLIISEMSRYYSGIDEGFVESILEATHRFSHWYDEKGKVVFIAEDTASDVIGCAVATPKRGGSVKLAPLLMKPSLASMEAHISFLQYIRSFFLERKSRKLYTLIPIADMDTVRYTRQAGFQPEGILREPYCAGVDFLVLSLFLNRTSIDHS